MSSKPYRYLTWFSRFSQLLCFFFFFLFQFDIEAREFLIYNQKKKNWIFLSVRRIELKKKKREKPQQQQQQQELSIFRICFDEFNHN